jgi:flagellar biosynthesis protein FlhG
MGSSGMHASGIGGQRTGACVIPFGGGKGGVGKTFLVANLATALARQGHRVVAVDGDLEGANLHTCLGVQRPRTSLADYVAHREEDLQKLLLDTHLPNLALIAATRSHLGSAPCSCCARCGRCPPTSSCSTWEPACIRP